MIGSWPSRARRGRRCRCHFIRQSHAFDSKPSPPFLHHSSPAHPPSRPRATRPRPEVSFLSVVVCSLCSPPPSPPFHFPRPVTIKTYKWNYRPIGGGQQHLSRIMRTHLATQGPNGKGKGGGGTRRARRRERGGAASCPPPFPPPTQKHLPCSPGYEDRQLAGRGGRGGNPPPGEHNNLRRGLSNPFFNSPTRAVCVGARVWWLARIFQEQGRGAVAALPAPPRLAPPPSSAPPLIIFATFILRPALRDSDKGIV